MPYTNYEVHISKKKFYQINQYIKAATLRVVDADASQVGILSKDEAIRLAQQKGLDLILVAPNAKPPVAKIVNFATFKYQLKKKEKSGKTSKSETKEIRLTPFIAENDLNNRVKKGRDFLTDGDRVKINVKFVGRQLARKDFGFDLLNRIADLLSDVGAVDQPAKMQGKFMSMTLRPAKKKKNEPQAQSSITN